MGNENLTLGSLFDGSGAFPLGAILCGIRPVWSSEVEPFPVRVTEKRLPGVAHYGDVARLDGGELPPVDIITFGSPCQDMSIAGKRAGLGGERSGLFYEAVRIIKEMRCATDGKYPRYAVWENVKGAFTSNRGGDFREVLEEFCRIGDEGVSVPRCDKWKNAGCILGESFSVAWRLLDAQHWGVPQRRERIYLVADFAGQGAGKILFESEGLSGYSAEGFRAWQGAAGGLAEGSGEAGCVCLNDQGGQRMDVTEDVACTLRAEAHHPPVVPIAAGFCTEHSAKARGIGYQEETSPTLRTGTVPAAVMFENHSQDSRYTGPLDVSQTVSATFGTGGNNQPFVVQHPPECFDVRFTSEGTRNSRGNVYPTETSRALTTDGNPPDGNQGGIAVVGFDRYNGSSTGGVAQTLNAAADTSGNNAPIVALEGNGCRPSHNGDGYRESGTMYTLNTVETHGVAYGIDRTAFNSGKQAGFNFAVDEEVEPTMVSSGPNAVGHSVYCSTCGNFMKVAEDVSNTLMARDYKDPQFINDGSGEEPYYIVRRLTPIECARLQGFPDWWCGGLASDEPDDVEVSRWMDIFETHRKAIGSSSRPKTENQVRKWLKEPYSDSAAYKMWGNGCALPNVAFVLAGIVYYAQF